MRNNLRMLVAIALFAVVANFPTAAAADIQPSIVYITPDQVKDVNASVSLNCTVDNPRGYTVIWLRKNSGRGGEDTFLSMGPTMALQDERLRLNVSADGREFVLTIRDIEPMDSGLYECQMLVSTVSKITKRVELHVNSPAVVDISAALPPQPSLVGSSVTLTCKAHGHPRPSMYWHRENNAIMPGGGNKYLGNELHIPSVQRQDRGIYYCVGQNGVGQPNSRSVYFEVQFAPLIRTPRPRTAQGMGYDAELECIVEAYPAPVIEWFQTDADGQLRLLRPEHSIVGLGYKITTSASTNEVTTSVLRVIQIQRRQLGDYVCRATNVAGQADGTVNLYNNSEPIMNYTGQQQLTSAASIAAIPTSLVAILLLI